MSYCEYVARLPAHQPSVHRDYHDTQYGFPLDDDNELFGRLILEINQAGLSWNTILMKQDNFRQAYDGFSIEKIAAYQDADRLRLLNDAGIIRNRLKVNAAIENARTVLGLQEEFGSFQAWLNHHHPLSKEAWTRLFKKTFRFTGREIVNEFLMSTGYLRGAHDTDCPVYRQVLASKPAWLDNPGHLITK
ncbi:MAG: DNA-3-methyladenine glycosylase I [Alcaligenaceae bacterium]|nr:DNA-3-methyladenine glycosylase I [Alcaligenaceae bacterium]